MLFKRKKNPYVIKTFSIKNHLRISLIFLLFFLIFIEIPGSTSPITTANQSISYNNTLSISNTSTSNTSNMFYATTTQPLINDTFDTDSPLNEQVTELENIGTRERSWTTDKGEPYRNITESSSVTRASESIFSMQSGCISKRLNSKLNQQTVDQPKEFGENNPQSKLILCENAPKSSSDVKALAEHDRRLYVTTNDAGNKIKDGKRYCVENANDNCNKRIKLNLPQENSPPRSDAGVKKIVQIKYSNCLYIGSVDNQVQPSGEGIIYNKDKIPIFVGEFHEGKRNGLGSKFENRKIVYSGSYKDGKRHGFGREIKDGETYYVKYKNGECMHNEKIDQPEESVFEEELIEAYDRLVRASAKHTDKIRFNSPQGASIDNRIRYQDGFYTGLVDNQAQPSGIGTICNNDEETVF